MSSGTRTAPNTGAAGDLELADRRALTTACRTGGMLRTGDPGYERSAAEITAAPLARSSSFSDVGHSKAISNDAASGWLLHVIAAVTACPTACSSLKGRRISARPAAEAGRAFSYRPVA